MGVEYSALPQVRDSNTLEYEFEIPESPQTVEKEQSLLHKGTHKMKGTWQGYFPFCQNDVPEPKPR